MDDKMINEIKLRARELCKIYSAPVLEKINERNEKIIQILMKEFELTHEKAEYYFRHNNDLE